MLKLKVTLILFLVLKLIVHDEWAKKVAQVFKLLIDKDACF